MSEPRRQFVALLVEVGEDFVWIIGVSPNSLAVVVQQFNTEAVQSFLSKIGPIPDEDAFDIVILAEVDFPPRLEIILGVRR